MLEGFSEGCFLAFFLLPFHKYGSFLQPSTVSFQYSTSAWKLQLPKQITNWGSIVPSWSRAWPCPGRGAALGRVRASPALPLPLPPKLEFLTVTEQTLVILGFPLNLFKYRGNQFKPHTT